MSEYRPKITGVAIALLFVALMLGGCLSRSGQTADSITYSLPTTLAINRGAALLSTNIVYDSSTEEGIYILIDGQRALKRKGDSVNWKGSFVPETETELDLRIVWNTEEKLDLAGTAKVVVKGVAPQQGAAVTTSPITFSGPVAYGVAKDSYIPGTTLTYVGHTGKGAELGGLFNEYPYRQIGDSIVWEGTLREGVYVRVELRTVQFDDNGLRLAGIATLWLGQ
ncbi:MAG: hypothetical protein R6X16_04525 [Anaerolineae bacterium]